MRMADEETQSDESASAEEPVEEIEEKPIAGIGTLVFGKWDVSQISCNDPGIAPYLSLRTVGVPHTGGRHANAWFGKSKLSIVERFINNLMRTGKYTGKKMGASKALEQAFDTIAERSGDNPMQVFVNAVAKAAPMEEITRIRFGAVSQPKAVDSSPSRRLDTALRHLAKGSQQGTHKSKKTLTQCIVAELTKAAAGDASSYAIGKKEEVERIASSAR